MTAEEWELLCDGCGRCCLVRLEDEESGEVFTTKLACKKLDISKCRCKSYERRHELVPDCIALSPDNIGELSWMPLSCAYRRLAEGRGLAWWHPLVSGNADSVHDAGISVRGWAVCEDSFDSSKYENYIYDYEKHHK